jgi:hypothetical protein
VHVDYLSGKVHAVPTRSEATSAEAAKIILEMALRSCDGILDVLVVDHKPKFTSTMFREFIRRIGSSLIVGSAFHKNTNAKTERVKGVLGDTLRAFANGLNDDWNVWHPYAIFSINNAASIVGGELIPSFIEMGAPSSHAARAPRPAHRGGNARSVRGSDEVLRARGARTASCGTTRPQGCAGQG